MKQGKTLNELAQELTTQAMAKRDYLVDTSALKLRTEGDVSRLALPISDGNGEFTVNELAHRQIADRLEIPFKYYQRMKAQQQALLDRNVNIWMKSNPERRMIRTLNGTARAFLSDRYRRIDNIDLAEAVLPIIAQMSGAEVISAELTDSKMYIKVINRTLEMEVKPGDVVRAGLVISNSEVGLGSVRVEPLTYRLVCSNGLVSQDYSQRKYHVGRSIDMEGEANELYRDETIQADDKAFMLKVQDTVRAAVDRTKFALIVDRMKVATGQMIQGSPVKAVETLAQRFQFTQAEQNSVLKHLIAGGDLSAYGLVNAVTRTSQDLENYDRATDFERFGGQLLALPSSGWREIANAA